VVGALAGAAHGLQAIPAAWRAALHGEWPLRSGERWDEARLVELADRLAGTVVRMYDAETPGLTLQQLAAWRSAFERIGWVQWRQFGRDDLDLIATGGFPMNVDDSEEPWVFGCKADGKDYKPAYLAVREPDRKRIFYAAGNWMEKNKGIVVATRCRIALFGTKSRQVFSWLYSDIKEFASGHGMGLLTLVLWHSQGDLMEINFTVPEGGVLDRLIVATASDTPTGGLAIAGAANRATTRADNKVEFKEAVEQFVRSAGVLGTGD
jgi:hypothetical protein